MLSLGLQSLVDFCLNKRASPTTFQSLLKQIDHKQQVTEEDVAGLISTQQRLDPLAVMYITSCALKDQSINLKFSTVFSHLKSATTINQNLMLTALVSQFRELQEYPFGLHDMADVTNTILTYIRYLLDQNQSHAHLLESSGRLVALISSSLPEHMSVTPLTGEQNDTLVKLASYVKDKSPSLSQDLSECMEKLQRKKTRRDSTMQSLSLSVGLPQHTSFLKTSKLPKFVWLNSAIQTWSTHKVGFLTAFEQFVKVKNNQNILTELVATSFEGYIISQQVKEQSPHFSKNWELFLVKRLPLLIKELKLKNVESSLISAMTLDPKVLQAIKVSSSGGTIDTNDDMFSSFPSTATDIRHEFLKSCIALQILSTSAFETILKHDAAADGRRIQTSDAVVDESGQIIELDSMLRRTLIDINTEFVPLEESGLLEFLRSLEKMEGTKQVELSKHIVTCITTFITNEDTSQLQRLCLALALVPHAVHAIMFHISPSTFLKPIMNFLDSWQSSTDDMNFQETYSTFGCVFLLFLFTVKEFNISLTQLIRLKTSIDQDSFCISFLTSMGTSSWKNPVGELNQHRSEVLSGWMAALFDSGGISDDLMRLSTVQECFELFPVIFQQAFVACKQGLTDVDTIKGGLEYFLQPFLLSTVVGLLSWCEDYLWKAQDIELLVNLMKTLVSPLELSGESVHIHRVIMSIFGSSLCKRLSELDNNNSPLRIDSGVLKSLRQSMRGGKSLGFFELDASTTILSFFDGTNGVKEISLSVAFQMEFQSLLTWGQSSTVSKYDHLFIPNMQRLLGEAGLIECFVEQVQHARVLNKNVQAVIELSAFLLVVDFVGYSSESRSVFSNSLKSESLPERPTVSLISGYNLLRALVQRRKSTQITTMANDKGEAFTLLYEKLIETVHALSSLD